MHNVAFTASERASVGISDNVHNVAFIPSERASVRISKCPRNFLEICDGLAGNGFQKSAMRVPEMYSYPNPKPSSRGGGLGALKWAFKYLKVL